jgi:CPA2 family monovalent cation:H+ antiporter-2
MLASVDGAPIAVDLMVILLVSAGVATLLAKLRLESIPGFLIAGAIIGPASLGVIREPVRVDQISQLAVILLMFTIGLHLDSSAMGRGMVHILGIGVVSSALFIALSWPILIWAGLEPPSALAVAMALSMSSTAVLVRVVGARREVRTVHARVGLGVAIVQDMAAIVVLGMLPLLARWAGTSAVGTAGIFDEWFQSLPASAEIAARGGLSVGGMIILIAAGRVLLPAAMRAVASAGSGELLLVFSAAVALAAALSTRVLGFSPEMGAFLAGFLLGATPFRHQLIGYLGPLRDILMAVFFTSVGLNVDPARIAEHWGVVLAGTVGVIGLKVLTIGGSGWALGMTSRAALFSGVYLGNAGEFALVVLTAAMLSGLVGPEEMALLIGVIVATLTISPLLVEPAHRLSVLMSSWPLAPWVRAAGLREGSGSETGPGSGHGSRVSHSGGALSDRHVVVAGFGPVGRAVADNLEVRGVQVTVIELNPRTVERQTQIGRRKMVYGDVTNPEVLESAGVPHACAVVITVPDDETSLRAVEVVRRMAPTAFVSARTNFLSGSFRAQAAGADHVTVEEVVTAEAMQREVIRELLKRYGQRTPGGDNPDDEALYGA